MRLANVRLPILRRGVEMKFFGREEELKELSQIRQLAANGSRLTVVTGRRRVGKTELIEQAYNDGRVRLLRGQA